MKAGDWGGWGAPKKKKRAPKPRPLPKPVDDIALPPGQRIVLHYPPVGLSPNDRLHWAKKNRLQQSYYRECWAETLAAKIVLPAERPLRIRVDFFPPDRARRDDDNPVAAFKSGRDGIAKALGIDDSQFRTVPVLHTDPRSCVVVTIMSGDDA